MRGILDGHVVLDRAIAERNRYPAMETSFANGAQLSACNAEAWNHWPTILKGLKWMFRGDAPLLVNPKPSWHKISWFAEFMAAIPQYGPNTTESVRLAIAAREHLFGWAETEGIDFDAKHTGLMHVYRNKADFDHAAAVNPLLEAGGLERRAVGRVFFCGHIFAGDGARPAMNGERPARRSILRGTGEGETGNGERQTGGERGQISSHAQAIARGLIHSIRERPLDKPVRHVSPCCLRKPKGE